MVEAIETGGIHQALGVHFKNITIGLGMTCYTTKQHASKVINGRKAAENDFKHIKEEAKKHELDKIDKNETHIQEMSIRVVDSSVKLFTNSAIILKSEFNQIKNIARVIDHLIKGQHSLISTEDKEYSIIKALEKELLADVHFGEHNLKLELKKIHDLEAEAGGGEGIQFMFKSPTLAMIQNYKMRAEINKIVKDEKQIEKLGKKIDAIYHKLQKGGREHAKKYFKKLNEDLKLVIKLARDEIKNSFLLCMEDWINIQVIIEISKGNEKLVAILAKNFEMPQQMARIIRVNADRILNHIREALHNQQIIVNQLYAEGRGAERAF